LIDLSLEINPDCGPKYQMILEFFFFPRPEKYKLEEEFLFEVFKAVWLVSSVTETLNNFEIYEVSVRLSVAEDKRESK